MEGDLIKINKWLLPLSWLYGLGVKLRNTLFDTGILKSKSYNIPIISVGNITVGGTGKTPHTEYLIELLRKQYQVAVLSRGYKRHTLGFLLAKPDTPMKDIGDEPYQMKNKFPDVQIAVDKNRRHGIETLCSPSETTVTPDVILLDDAYQHRYVKPGINILLVDYHRMINEDVLLPAGRLREPLKGKDRANIVIVTKCPYDIKPMGYRVICKMLKLYPFQELFFTTLHYDQLHCPYTGVKRSLRSIAPNEQILLLTGIASPEQMRIDLARYTQNITPLTFGDHHYYTTEDIRTIARAFKKLPEKKIIITTEKDYSRLSAAKGLDDEIKKNLFVLPIRIEFMQNQGVQFNERIISYVHKHHRNRKLVKK